PFGWDGAAPRGAAAACADSRRDQQPGDGPTADAAVGCESGDGRSWAAARIARKAARPAAARGGAYPRGPPPCPPLHCARPVCTVRQLLEDPQVVIASHLVTLIVIVVAFGVASIAVRLARTGLDRVVRASESASAERRAALHRRALRLTRALTLLAYGVAAII